MQFHAIRPRRFHDYLPGETDPSIEDIQRQLAEVGFSVSPTGTYDARTSAAILEFRGAAGLPNVNRIDEQLMGALADEVDRRVGSTSVPGSTPVQVMDPLSITGRIPKSAWIVGLLLAGWLVYRNA